MEDWLIESSKKFESARYLSKEEKIVLKYFLENVSVGDLRAIADLSKKGIENPENVIESLIEKGFLERGNDCFNLSYYLRIFVSRRGMPNFD